MTTRTGTDWPVIALLFLAGLCAAMQFAKVAPVMDAVGAAFGFSLVEAGLAVSVLGLVGLVFGVAAGAMVAAAGLKRAILAALFAATVFAAIGAAAPGGLAFLLSRLGEGFAHLVIVVAAPALMVAHAGEKDRPLALALWGCFFGFGFGLTSLVAPPVVAAGGWRALLGLHAVFAGLVGLGLVAAFARSSYRDEALPLPGPARIIAAHGALYASGGPLLLAACFSAYTMLFLAVLTFLGRYLVEVAGWSAAVAGSFIAALTAVNLVVTLLTGWLVRAGLRFGAGMIAAFLVAAVAMAVLFSATSSLLVVPAAILAMAAFGTMPGMVFTHVPAIAPGPGGAAMTFGGIAQFGNLGTFSGTPLMALAVSHGGWVGATIFVSLVCLAGIALALAVARRLKPMA